MLVMKVSGIILILYVHAHVNIFVYKNIRKNKNKNIIVTALQVLVGEIMSDFYVLMWFSLLMCCTMTTYYN